MTADDVKALTRAMYERERDEFDLMGMIERAKQACHNPELAAVVMAVVEAVGHEYSSPVSMRAPTLAWRSRLKLNVLSEMEFYKCHSYFDPQYVSTHR